MQYGLTFKGQRQLFWSQGLRDLLGLVVEQTDDEVVEGEAQELQQVATLDPRAWDMVKGEGVRGEVLQAFSISVRNGLDFLYSLGCPAEWVYLSFRGVELAYDLVLDDIFE